MNENEINTWAGTVDGLRALADFLEAHPSIPVNRHGSEIAITMSPRIDSSTEAEQRAEIDRIAALHGSPVIDRTGEGGHYETCLTFGLVRLKASHIPAARMDEWHDLMSYHPNLTRDRAA